MKLQNLIIIFIIIIIPIVLIFTLYLNLETKTILLQTNYDEKLIEAAKEAVESLEINTTEWTNEETATLANQKRKNVENSIKTFITSLSNKFGISGTSNELILNYVPAIVYIMYDGYYIYSPTYVPKTINSDNGVQLYYYRDASADESKVSIYGTQTIGDNLVSGEPMFVLAEGEIGESATYNGVTLTFTTAPTKAAKTYKHVLKTFVPYSKEYVTGDNKYVINYTLDNYVRIYGEDVAREGYIIEDFGDTNKIEFTNDTIPQVKFNGVKIEPEQLTENIAIRDSYSSDVKIENYPYIYYRTGEDESERGKGSIGTSVNKAYYDGEKFFEVNEAYVKVPLRQDGVVGTSKAKYKKLLVCTNTSTGEYIELHQLINGNDDEWYYINSSNEYIRYEKSNEINSKIDKEQDCSAINYYIENNEFNKWLKSVNGLNLNEEGIRDILADKNEVIINNINNNLYLSMKNYSANSKINYELPEITATDWEQALSNVSMIAFLQGNKIGLKTYNNYTVVSSTHNNEYVSDESLYYISNQDYYYHTNNCDQISSNDGSIIDGVYKNTEFKVQRYSYEKKIGDVRESKSGYYYRHNTSDTDSKVMAQCFNCIVNRNKFVKDDVLDNAYLTAYYNAIARERYVLYQNIRLTDSSATTKEAEPLAVIHATSTLGDNRTVTLTITGGSGNYTIDWKYRTSISGLWQNVIPARNQTTYTTNKTYYVQYTVKDTVTQETVINTVTGGADMY